jgi:hypothetical protein
MSSPIYFNQSVIILDTTSSLNPTTASLILYGGISINNTIQSNDISTGSLVVSGGIAIQGNLYGTLANIPNLISVNHTSTNIYVPGNSTLELMVQLPIYTKLIKLLLIYT